MKLTYDEAIIKIVNHYGIHTQAVKAIEERSELIKEICKWLAGKYDHDALIDELADDRITSDEIIAFLGCEAEVDERVRFKLQRQLTRMRQGE